MILRHADRDGDELTTQGIEACKQLAQKLPQFDLVVSSPAHRAQQTAELLASTKPDVDSRAELASGEVAAEGLLSLTKDLLAQLPPNEQALIVTHEVNIVALHNLLNPNGPINNVGKLNGVSLDENLNTKIVNNGN